MWRMRGDGGGGEAESYARMRIFPAEKLICRLATYLCCAGSCLAGCIAACKYVSISSLRTNRTVLLTGSYIRSMTCLPPKRATLTGIISNGWTVNH